MATPTRPRFEMAPLVVWPIATLFAIVALLALAVGVDAATRVMEVSIDRYDAVHHQPSHPVSIFGERVVVPASQTFASYTIGRRSAVSAGWSQTAELPGDYRHAAVGPSPSTVRLSEPRRPRADLRLVFQLEETVAAPEWKDLYLHDCDEACVEALVPTLDAWLADPTAPRFHHTLRDPASGRAAAAFAVFALAVVLLLVQFSCRVEVATVGDSIALTRRLGPFRRVVAQVLLSEVAGVRVLARTWGPLTFHRAVLGLGHGRTLAPWPWGGRLARALRDRTELLALLERERDAHRTTSDASPFRG